MVALVQPIVWWFLWLSLLFAATHLTAMTYFLYWHFWWFDILMHSWGGILIAMGIHSLATLPHVPVRATYRWLFLALFVATLSWEGFERYFGLFEADGYWVDATQDVVLAFFGGLLTHHVLLRYRMQ